MQTKNLTCVICPRGCSLEVDIDKDRVLVVRGNSCPRGEKYAESELFHSERILTTTISVEGRKHMLPVRTETAIPKEKLFACMEYLKEIRVIPPIATHAVIVSDILGTGVSVIASASFE